MHAFLVVGGTNASRKKAIEDKLLSWRVGTFDRIFVTGESGSIGIAEIRDLEHHMVLTPYQSPLNAGVINNADTLTPQAQQALLKTLEEPPPHSHLILEAANAETLLPTVISRCEVINLGAETHYSPKEIASGIHDIEELFRADTKGRLALIDTIATNRDAAADWTNLALAASREALIGKHQLSPGTSDLLPTKLVRALLTAQGQLSANVNPKLVLDNLFLNAI